MTTVPQNEYVLLKCDVLVHKNELYWSIFMLNWDVQLYESFQNMENTCEKHPILIQSIKYPTVSRYQNIKSHITTSNIQRFQHIKTQKTEPNYQKPCICKRTKEKIHLKSHKKYLHCGLIKHTRLKIISIRLNIY